MDAVCARGDAACEARALTAALHALHLYCATISVALICCCAPARPHWQGRRWRGQNVRGVSSACAVAAWSLCAGAGCTRSAARAAGGTLAAAGALAGCALHAALWTRRAAAPLLYLALYWLLAAAGAAAQLYHLLLTPHPLTHVDTYIQAIVIPLSLLVSAVDCICFYDEVTKRSERRQKTSNDSPNMAYVHNEAHFFSKISFYWLNSLLFRGYEEPLEEEDLGELPENEKSVKYYTKFRRIYKELENTKTKQSVSIWRCYIRLIWPNFYIAGAMKLLGDLLSVVPPLGLAVIIQYIAGGAVESTDSPDVTLREFFTNGYVMLLIITLALIGQAFLSQNATHLVTVEGAKLKAALQGMVYDKCMRLAPWSSSESESSEESPLLRTQGDAGARAGLLANLMSQDTYNVMSCVWICHYLWAIPLKISVILYLLYTKLGVSAIIGTAVSVLIITPLQFYIGKKLSDNSREIAKCTDHRISKMAEILQGMNVIKLYVWEDLFREKIMHLREVELRLLNKDSIYWNFLTFTTQASTILVTVITFVVYYFMDNSDGLTAVNVFAGLALFNQLTIPLLILPVTVLMVIQAMVSTKRIKYFLELTETNNAKSDNGEDCPSCQRRNSDRFNEAFVDISPDETPAREAVNSDEAAEVECGDQFSDDEVSAPVARQEYLVRIRNAVFSWRMKNDASLEIDELDIPSGKLVMIVGSTGSGKSSLLSAILGEMYLERGEILYSGEYSSWYAGQPPWLVEGSVRDNIVLGGAWCAQRYARVLRATGLRPDLQLLPEGDATRLGSRGAPLSGGQRVRVCVARALYARARALALDEPLAALDAALARHVVARALVPAARAGRTVLVATNRLELLHYADLVIAMEEGRVAGYGRAASLGRWSQRAAEAAAAAARGAAGPPGGAARERRRLQRVLSRTRYHEGSDATLGISEAAGAHLLAEVRTCAGGSWRRRTRTRPALERQLSSPPPSMQTYKWRRDVRRAVSADASDAVLRREASLLRRLLRPRVTRGTQRWTPKPLRRLLSSDSDTPAEEHQHNGTTEDSAAESTYTSLTSNGVETTVVTVAEPDLSEAEHVNECAVWWEYARACGWWGAAYCAAAACAQGCSLAADCWLAKLTADHSTLPLTQDQLWNVVRTYGAWSVVGLAAAGAAGGACAAAGAAGRRTLHERLLHATLHAPLHAARAPLGHTLHRFSADVHVIDKKLPTAVSRWAQLVLVCVAAAIANAAAAPVSLLAALPAAAVCLALQTVYLYNARELQRMEAAAAGGAVSLAAEACAGAGTLRAGRLQPRMRSAFLRALDVNLNATLVLNAANRWLGLSLDLLGAVSVCIALGIALCTGGGAAAGLAGAYSLLLPAYLAHLAKARADLDLQLAAVERVRTDTNIPQEDYRDDCPIPPDWQRNGKIEFENLTVQEVPGGTAILHSINLSIAPGEKIAVCGRSGAGKSTLLAACAGGACVRAGRVRVDGADAAHVPLRALRHRVLSLPQDAAMFSGTLRENLDPLAVHTDEEIWHSLRAVGLHEYVSAQPAGLECAVGTCGAGWSGGRAARACAARAVLRAHLASALLLDEPAAALPAAPEQALLAALASAAPNTTIITVAHRISSIRGYDRAVVLDEGRVVETGKVSALLAVPSSRLARMLAAAHRQT